MATMYISDEDLQDLNEVCGYYGLTFEEVFNYMVEKTVHYGELPFNPLAESNVEETLQAIEDVDTHITFKNFDEMIKYINSHELEEL